MEYLAHNLISPNLSEAIVNSILSDQEAWADGKKTAGSHAAKVKNNFQLSRDSDVSRIQTEQVSKEISNNELIKCFCLPKSIHGLMFTRARSGHSYGMHVDNPYMKSGRSDLSFTLFLSEKDEYEGGNLYKLWLVVYFTGSFVDMGVAIFIDLSEVVAFEKN